MHVTILLTSVIYTSTQNAGEVFTPDFADFVSTDERGLSDLRNLI